jgi:16S rRNA (guanine1207-N2)-methyltransferase
MNRTPYELALESRVEGGPSEYRFHTADGVASKQSFRTAELLLLEALWDADPGGLLCPEANYGVVGTVLSAVADAVEMTESSARAVRLCERNARENDADASVSLLADLRTLDRRVDTVAYAPKAFTPVEVGKQRIADTASRLRPGGRLYLAASKRAGLSRYEDCLREVGTGVERIDADGDCRLLAATRPEVASADGGAGPPTYVSPREKRPTVDGVDLPLVTVPGLFSATGLDDGTRLLLESATVRGGERVLDLCCGYGPVGVYAARTADAEVWLTDDDRIATRCAECSLRTAGVHGRVVTADCLDGVAGRTFDAVLCNPPTHAGSGVLSELLGGARNVLATDGRLRFVHHRDLDLRPHLSRFGTVERVRTGEEHVVLEARP